MKKAYIAMMVILMMGLAACSMEDVTTPTMEIVAVTETTEATELTTAPTETAGKTTEPTAEELTTETTEQTEPPNEPTQAPDKPPKETKPVTQETTHPEQTEPPATTEPPADIEPPEIIDLQALIDYGREYAANKYGYEVCIGLRDGYYPADDHLIHTMEDGYKSVRASVDCTTRMLLACPGVQIVKEIDGVLCRARIDIAIQDFGDGAYRIWIYYG